MYNGIQKIEEVIDYIESNLICEPDIDVMAAKMSLSVYEFRRIFAFIVGCPISEYIRKRRLSLAATEIMASDKADILKISEKYGYSSQSAFTRAFCEQHGVSPSALASGKSDINLFTCPRFSVTISGRENIPFKLIRSQEFFIHGFSALSDISDTCCCEDVWNSFYESGADKEISGDEIYVSYTNMQNCIRCCIGEKSTDGERIPASCWACFRMDTTDDEVVNEIYTKIIYEWLPSAKLTRNSKLPTVEVFPSDMSQDGFEWEIRIPIIKE